MRHDASHDSKISRAHTHRLVEKSQWMRQNPEALKLSQCHQTFNDPKVKGESAGGWVESNWLWLFAKAFEHTCNSMSWDSLGTTFSMGEVVSHMISCTISHRQISWIPMQWSWHASRMGWVWWPNLARKAEIGWNESDEAITCDWKFDETWVHPQGCSKPSVQPYQWNLWCEDFLGIPKASKW